MRTLLWGFLLHMMYTVVYVQYVNISLLWSILREVLIRLGLVWQPYATFRLLNVYDVEMYIAYQYFIFPINIEPILSSICLTWSLVPYSNWNIRRRLFPPSWTELLAEKHFVLVSVTVTVVQFMWQPRDNLMSYLDMQSRISFITLF